MAALSIRDVDDDVRDRLRVRAARNGRSMEAEVRAILTAAVNDSHVGGDAGGDYRNMLVVLHERFAELGGVDLDIPQRNNAPRAADFSE